MKDEKILEDRKPFATFMNLEKVYDRVGWKGMRKPSLEGIRYFYKEVSTCVQVNGEVSESWFWCGCEMGV